MNTYDLAYESAVRPGRARHQRALGIFLMTMLLTFVLAMSVWAISEVQYRNCLSQNDRAYATAGGLDKITWNPAKSAAATRCEAHNRVQNLYLR